jgi:rSAM/selenodomain-associated transferase 1
MFAPVRRDLSLRETINRSELANPTANAMVPQHEPARRVLGLFAKQPSLGQVKTRLAAACTADAAVRIAEAFLTDTVARLANIAARRVLAFSPPTAQDYFAGLTQDHFSLTPQTEGDLGRRMSTFFAEQFQAGAESVVLVGTDSPTLPLALIEQAFQELLTANLVLGPATDGGYYLIGCAARVPPIFEGVAWSSNQVLIQTVERLQDPAWRLAVLPPWYDVDTLDDWRMLQGHVAALRRAGVDPNIPCTERLLQESLR